MVLRQQYKRGKGGKERPGFVIMSSPLGEMRCLGSEKSPRAGGVGISHSHVFVQKGTCLNSDDLTPITIIDYLYYGIQEKWLRGLLET